MTNDPLDFIKMQAQHCNFGEVLDIDALAAVTVVPVPARVLSNIQPLVKPRECFNNAFNTMSCFPDIHNTRYCVGLAADFFPVSHAWIKVGDHYYDPTWQLHNTLGNLYVPYFELGIAELLDIVIANERRPPEAWEVARFLMEQKRKELSDVSL